MKKFKKMAALLLALTMVLGMGMTVFATPHAAKSDGTYGTKGDTASISVGGITKEAGVTVTAYKIIEAKYGNSGNYFSGYNPLYTTTPALTIPTKADEVMDISEAQLAQIVDQIKKAGTEGIPMDLGDDGVARKDGLDVGSYLVVVSGAETKVYSPIVASIYYTNKEGNTNGIEEGNIEDIRIKEEKAWVKVSDTPKVTKDIIENEEEKKGSSVAIGQMIDYQVNVESIPYYGGNHPKLEVVDTMDQGLAFEGDPAKDITVYVTASNIQTDEDGLTGATVDYTALVYGTDYTVARGINEAGKQTITVNFVVSGKYMLNDYVGKTAVIRYSAKVTDDAVLNNNANVNDVVLNFSKDSKVDGADGQDEDKVYSYTFDIDGEVTGSILRKTGEEQDMTSQVPNGALGLQGAEFTLYTDEACKDVYTNSVFNGTVVSTAGGQLPIKGLKEGTYYLKETKAPEGYTLNTNVFKIEIEAVYKTEGAKTEIGQLVSWTVTIDGEAVSTFSVNNGTLERDIKKTDIPNTKLTSLPSTGGIGTTIFTIGGCLIMIAAAGLFFASRRKTSK